MFLFMDVLRNTYSLNIDELFRVCGIVTTVAINKCFAQFFCVDLCSKFPRKACMKWMGYAVENAELLKNHKPIFPRRPITLTSFESWIA